MKLSIIKIFALALTISLVSCEGTTNGNGNSATPKPGDVNIISQNIDAMASRHWDKNTYYNILNNQIPQLRNNTDKEATTAKIKATYMKIMVADAKATLTGGCTTSAMSSNAETKLYTHKELEELFAELNKFPNAPGYVEVKELKKIHDEASRFANSGIANQKVNSYRDDYDTSYEDRHISQANSYLNNAKVYCNQTKEKLKRLTNRSAYESRRKAYCQAIVDQYLQTQNKELREYNAARGKLNVYSGDSSLKAKWLKDIEDHYQKLNQEP